MIRTKQNLLLKESFFVHFLFLIAMQKENVEPKKKARLIEWFESSRAKPPNP